MVSVTAVSRIPYFSKRKAACHLSVRPEPGTDNAEERRLVPYLVLLREEFTFAARLSSMPGGLLPRRFTLTVEKPRRSAFCCTGLSAAYSPQHPSFQKDSLLFAVRTFLRKSLTGEKNPAMLFPRPPAITNIHRFKYSTTCQNIQVFRKKKLFFLLLKNFLRNFICISEDKKLYFSGAWCP